MKCCIAIAPEVFGKFCWRLSWNIHYRYVQYRETRVWRNNLATPLRNLYWLTLKFKYHPLITVILIERHFSICIIFWRRRLSLFIQVKRRFVKHGRPMTYRVTSHDHLLGPQNLRSCRTLRSWTRNSYPIYCDVFGRTPVVARQPKVKHLHGYARD
jgi:hypothetical protein